MSYEPPRHGSPEWRRLDDESRAYFGRSYDALLARRSAGTAPWVLVVMLLVIGGLTAAAALLLSVV